VRADQLNRSGASTGFAGLAPPRLDHLRQFERLRDVALKPSRQRRDPIFVLCSRGERGGGTSPPSSAESLRTARMRAYPSSPVRPMSREHPVRAARDEAPSTARRRATAVDLKRHSWLNSTDNPSRVLAVRFPHESREHRRADRRIAAPSRAGGTGMRRAATTALPTTGEELACQLYAEFVPSNARCRVHGVDRIAAQETSHPQAHAASVPQKLVTTTPPAPTARASAHRLPRPIFGAPLCRDVQPLVGCVRRHEAQYDLLRYCHSSKSLNQVPAGGRRSLISGPPG